VPLLNPHVHQAKPAWHVVIVAGPVHHGRAWSVAEAFRADAALLADHARPSLVQVPRRCLKRRASSRRETPDDHPAAVNQATGWRHCPIIERVKTPGARDSQCANSARGPCPQVSLSNGLACSCRARTESPALSHGANMT
jgi:hypothetical protein